MNTPVIDQPKLDAFAARAIGDLTAGYTGVMIRGWHAPSIDAARGHSAAAGLADRVALSTARAVDYHDQDYGLICFFDTLRDLGDPEVPRGTRPKCWRRAARSCWSSPSRNHRALTTCPRWDSRST